MSLWNAVNDPIIGSHQNGRIKIAAQDFKAVCFYLMYTIWVIFIYILISRIESLFN